MKILVWLLRVVIFIALFGLAVKNSAVVELRFYFEQTAQWPLSLIVLAVFIAGVVVGLSAVLATVVSLRRELGKLRRLTGADKRD